MKHFIFFGMMLMTISASAAGRLPDKTVQESRDWRSFKLSIEELRREDEVRGLSYIISGSLVTIGGLLAGKSTNDPTSKFVYGVTSSVGIAAVAYGLVKMNYGNEYNSFYNSMEFANLSLQQRDTLVKSYMENENERRRHARRVEMLAHFVAGALNVYSASTEKDQNAKTFFSVLAGVNLALGFSYLF